jgi:hypothetical protein
MLHQRGRPRLGIYNFQRQTRSTLSDSSSLILYLLVSLYSFVFVRLSKNPTFAISNAAHICDKLYCLNHTVMLCQ